MKKKLITILLLSILISITLSIIPSSAFEYGNIISGVKFNTLINTDGTHVRMFATEGGTNTFSPTWANTATQAGISTDDAKLITFPMAVFQGEPPLTPAYKKMVLTLQFNNISEVIDMQLAELQIYNFDFEFYVYGVSAWDWGTIEPYSIIMKDYGMKEIPLESTYKRDGNFMRIHIQGKIFGADLNNLFTLQIGFNKTTSDMAPDFRIAIGSDNGLIISEYTSAQEAIDIEEERAEEGGQDAIDDALEGVPDESGDLADAITRLVGAFQYTGTDCKISFPGIKTPAFQDLGIEEHTLLEAQDVDLSKALEIIPTILLTLIQALCTVLLVIFLVKQMWNEITYALLGRSEKNDE